MKNEKVSVSGFFVGHDFHYQAYTEARVNNGELCRDCRTELFIPSGRRVQCTDCSAYSFRQSNPTRLQWLWCEKIDETTADMFSALHDLSLRRVTVDIVECVGENGIVICAISNSFDPDYILKRFETAKEASAWIQNMGWHIGRYVTIEGHRDDVATAIIAEGFR